MPNHVTNILSFPRGGEEEVRALILDEHGDVDFNRIIPQPDNILKGNLTLEDMKQPNWYNWNTAHWGTKWNAYSQDVAETGDILFQTAWSTPMRIWEALATRFPQVDMKVRYANEDIGHNCGTVLMHSGRLAHVEPSDPNLFAYRVIYGYETVEEVIKGRYDPYYDTIDEWKNMHPEWSEKIEEIAGKIDKAWLDSGMTKYPESRPGE